MCRPFKSEIAPDHLVLTGELPYTWRRDSAMTASHEAAQVETVKNL